MTITLFGIPNCDTVRKAREWLHAHGIEHRFHDHRKDGVSAARLQTWVHAVGWEALLNRKGTTWRRLDDVGRASVIDAPSAIRLMVAHSSVIRRPVVEHPGGLSVGFDATEWERAFG